MGIIVDVGQMLTQSPIYSTSGLLLPNHLQIIDLDLQLAEGKTGVYYFPIYLSAKTCSIINPSMLSKTAFPRLIYCFIKKVIPKI